MKYTTAYLKRKGYTGIYRNTMTGERFENVGYILDQIADTANTDRNRLIFTNDDVRGMVYVQIKDFKWTPYDTVCCYAERKMTAKEIAKADKRLAAQGMSVIRSAQ